MKNTRKYNTFVGFVVGLFFIVTPSIFEPIANFVEKLYNYTFPLTDTGLFQSFGFILIIVFPIFILHLIIGQQMKILEYNKKNLLASLSFFYIGIVASFVVFLILIAFAIPGESLWL